MNSKEYKQEYKISQNVVDCYSIVDGRGADFGDKKPGWSNTVTVYYYDEIRSYVWKKRYNTPGEAYRSILNRQKQNRLRRSKQIGSKD